MKNIKICKILLADCETMSYKLVRSHMYRLHETYGDERAEPYMYDISDSVNIQI